MKKNVTPSQIQSYDIWSQSIEKKSSTKIRFQVFFIVKNNKNYNKMTGFMFNIDGGYLEGLCRGFKCGILKQSDYLNLVQCETLEGEFYWK